jgi:hypothetical protein
MPLPFHPVWSDHLITVHLLMIPLIGHHLLLLTLSREGRGGGGGRRVFVAANSAAVGLYCPVVTSKQKPFNSKYHGGWHNLSCQRAVDLSQGLTRAKFGQVSLTNLGTPQVTKHLTLFIKVSCFTN